MFKSIKEYIEWYNTKRPHMSLDWNSLETPEQAFYRKWANIRKEPNGTVGNFYSKLKKKKGSAKASSKAKMLRIIYCVLKEHRPYQS